MSDQQLDFGQDPWLVVAPVPPEQEAQHQDDNNDTGLSALLGPVLS